MWKKSVMDKVDKFMESQVNTLSVLGSRVQRFFASGFFISINPIGLIGHRKFAKIIIIHAVRDSSDSFLSCESPDITVKNT